MLSRSVDPASSIDFRHMKSALHVHVVIAVTLASTARGVIIVVSSLLQLATSHERVSDSASIVALIQISSSQFVLT